MILDQISVIEINGKAENLTASTCLEGQAACMYLWTFQLTQCKSYINGSFVCEAMRSNYFSKTDNPTEKILVNNLALILIMLSSGSSFICLVHLEQDQNLKKTAQEYFNFIFFYPRYLQPVSTADSWSRKDKPRLWKNLCSLLKFCQY